MTDDIPDLTGTSQSRASPSRAVSFVWLVPIAALLTALFVAVQTYSNQGPLIQIAFEDAAGVLPDETELRFRNVPVGLVERVEFNDDLSRVLVDVRVDKKVAPFVDNGAAFWIVRPEVTTSGVSGLETVLSGVYIEGTWDTEPGGLATTHTAQPRAPLVTAYRKGTIIKLRSDRAQGLTENSPLVFKGVQVGRLGAAEISQDGNFITADAIIFEPHDRLVSTATRFWDTSGFNLSIGPSGAALEFSSIASLISGGITFGTLVSGGTPLQDGAVFDVFPNENSARNAIFEGANGETLTLSMVFDDNVSGLVADADVEWRGLRIGRVLNVSGIVDVDAFGDQRVRLLATAEINTSRFGLDTNLPPEAALAYLSARVQEGLRARLATASLLGGALKIEWITDDTAPDATLNLNSTPFPTFPVTDSAISDMSATAEGVFQRVNALPVEDLLDSAIRFLDTATLLVADEDLRDTPGEILGLLADARNVIGSEDVQALPKDLSLLVTDLQSASGDLRALLSDIRDAQAVERLLTAVDQAGAAAASVQVALAGVPDLTGRVTTFVDRANTLPLNAMVEQATELATETRNFIGSAPMQNVPSLIADAFEELEEVLVDIAEADTPALLESALQGASDAATAVEQAVADVPSVVQRLDQIAANAEDVNLDTLAAEFETVLSNAADVLGDTRDADLPQALAEALEQANAALADLRAGGLIDSANATLSSAREASAAIENAANDLPALVDRLDGTLAQAGATLSDYQDGSTFSRETLSALREIERAAKALSSLARAIERNPNSLILGR